MRSSIVLMACTAMVLLGGCQAEPDFDTKFEQQSRDLAAKARSIDADAKKQLDAALSAPSDYSVLQCVGTVAFTALLKTSA